MVRKRTCAQQGGADGDVPASAVHSASSTSIHVPWAAPSGSPLEGTPPTGRCHLHTVSRRGPPDSHSGAGSCPQTERRLSQQLDPSGGAPSPARMPTTPATHASNITCSPHITRPHLRVRPVSAHHIIPRGPSPRTPESTASRTLTIRRESPSPPDAMRTRVW